MFKTGHKNITENNTAVNINDLEHLFNTYYRKLCLYALSIVDSFPIAEDIVQETFIKFWNNKSKVNYKGSMKAYIYTAVKNNSIQYLKDNCRYKYEILDDYVDSFENIEFSEDDIEEKKRQLYAEISKLPERCREVFELVVFGNMTYKEAAEDLGIAPSSVKTQLSIAMKRLRESFNVLHIYLFL
jgi:RNA polymerase sigma-70 factor (ECF subfamily)